MGFLLPAVVVLIFDQFTKQFFWHLGQNFDVIDGLLRITLVRNSGAAFGMFQGGGFFSLLRVLLPRCLSSISASGFPKRRGRNVYSWE